MKDNIEPGSILDSEKWDEYVSEAKNFIKVTCDGAYNSCASVVIMALAEHLAYKDGFSTRNCK